MVLMFGQFSPDAIVDGRNRVIPFRLDQESGLVTAIVPHFWEEMDLDPTYSVLLGESKDSCQHKHSKNVSKTVYIAVFVTLGGVGLISVAGYFLIPKIRRYLKVRKHSRVELESVPSTTSLNGNHSESEGHSPVIEKVPDMEAYTSAGRFTVRM